MRMAPTPIDIFDALLLNFFAAPANDNKPDLPWWEEGGDDDDDLFDGDGR